MTAPSPLPTRNGTSSRRIVGIDLARFAAIVGMMAAHLVSPLSSVPTAPAFDRVLGLIVGATVGSTSATTFAVLGGVSLVLLTRSMHGAPSSRILLSLGIRGVLIALIGAALVPLDGPISVVLTFYGVAMIIAAPAVLLPSWAVAAVAGILWIFGGAVNAWIRSDIVAVSRPDIVFGALRDLLVTGHYPAITWVAYMLVGILIARALLAAREAGTLLGLCTRLAIAGAALYLAITVAGRVVRMRPDWFALPDVGERMLSSGYGAPIGTELWMLLIPTPHSGNPADMLRTVGGACVLIGLLVGVFDAHSPRIGFAVEAIRAAGAAPLTIYTAHVVTTAALHHAATQQVIATGANGLLPWYGRGTVIFLLQLAGVVLVGAVLAKLHRRGPLETLLGWLSGSSRRRQGA